MSPQLSPHTLVAPVPSGNRRLSKVVERRLSALTNPIAAVLHSPTTSRQINLKASLDGVLAVSDSPGFEQCTYAQLQNLNYLETEGSRLLLQVNTGERLNLEF
jgi:hypothetical protein